MNKLKETIHEKKMSYAEVGRMIGYGRDMVSRHCSGDRKISAEAAYKYNKALGIPLHALRPDIFEKEEQHNDKER